MIDALNQTNYSTTKKEEEVEDEERKRPIIFID